MTTSTTCTRARPLGARRLAGLLAAGALGATGAAGFAGSASAAHTRHGAGPATVTIAHRGSLGTILVGTRGMTLYHFTKDERGAIACSGGCLKIWPPLLLRGKAALRPGRGVTHLGVLNRPGVGRQVTYDGEPLYYYAGDTKPGQAAGQGFEHLWFVVHPKPAASPGHVRARTR